MNAVRKLPAPAPVAKAAAVRHRPVALLPIPWGEPDPVLAQGICRHMREATPPIEVPFNPRTYRRVKRDVRHYFHY